MNAKRKVSGLLCSAVCLVAVGTSALGPGQQAPAEKPSELVVGKLVYVASMQGGLDAWIVDSLRRWGKYKVTSDPEGVDLVIQAAYPQNHLRLEDRGGVAQPRGADRPHLPSSKTKSDQVSPTSISVIDWVTSKPVWQVELLTRKPKKDEAALPAGPQTKIFSRSLTPDQLAEKVVTTLKAYEEGLEKLPAGKSQ